MKNKVLFIMLTFILLLNAMAINIYSAEMPLRIVVNNKKLTFPDAEPFLDSNARIQVPVRFIAEALNSTVDWNGAEGKVTITSKNSVAILFMGSKNINVNGLTKPLDTAPVIIDGRTFVPIRFVSEALGAEVEWQENIRTVYIDLAEKTEKKPSEYNVGGFVVDIAEKDVFVFNNTGGRTIEKESKLIVVESGEPENNPVIDLMLPRNKVGADIEKQMAEAKAILQQKLGRDCVNEIMDYVYTAEEMMTVLDLKKFSDDNYNIYVNAVSRSPIGISVYAK